MKSELVNKLVDMGIIKEGTIITVKGRTRGNTIAKEYDMAVALVEPINKNIKGTGYHIVVEYTGDPMRAKLNLNNESIVSIEGMNPKQLAKAYDLKEDGSKKPMGKPRGRPKKNTK